MENRFLYRKMDNGEIEILRCNEPGDQIQVPAYLEERPVTALGDYVFSGEAMREIKLPPTIRKIGRYAFYNCDGLRKLCFSSTIRDIGAGAFNGCRKITELDVLVKEEERSCLKEILAELDETLTVHYHQIRGIENERAELLFPVFYEEAVENTPARMLETHTHGCGHRYRYCFRGTGFAFSEYDSIFPHAIVQEKPAVVAALAFNRLRFPLGLSEAAAGMYGSWITENVEGAALYLIELNDTAVWKWFVEKYMPENSKTDLKTEFEHVSADCLGNEGLAVRAREEFNNIKKPVLGKTGFDKLINISNRFGCMEAVSLLMDARYRAFPVEKKKFVL